jgi:hypothetical protein
MGMAPMIPEASNIKSTKIRLICHGFLESPAKQQNRPQWARFDKTAYD